MRIKLLSLSLLIAGGLFSQTHFCYTTESQNKWFSQQPALKAEFEKLQQEAAANDREMFANGYQLSGKSAAASSYTIPVVFHILHLGGQENISDAQVIDAVNILTRDFNRENADTSDVVAQFKGIIGNPSITFALATRDPNGNCTNGIVRHWDTNTDWDGDFQDYVYTWPRQRYLNIYVVRSLESGAAGYTYLPGSGIPSSADAILILSSYVGSIGTGNIGLSRALTHEVGHWLNLPHTWGGTNQPGVACGDEGVSDTPETQGFTSCNLGNATVCNPGVVENMQNYMDYAYCQRMFTNGQSIRMQNAMNSPIGGRNNLSSALNLSITGVSVPATNCVPMVDISALPSLTICAGKPLTLTSYTSNADPATYQWSAGNGGSIANPTAGVTSVIFSTPGTTTVSCLVSNAYGSDFATVMVTVNSGQAELGSNYFESFEEATLPYGWTAFNMNSATGWNMTSDASSHDIISMYIPGETMPADAISILESPSIDFKNNPGAKFSFKYAYAKKNSANKDLFKIQASKNCGGSWTDIYSPGNNVLSQGSGGTKSALFIPESFEWKYYDQLLNHPNFFSFKNEENVRLRFYFQEDVGGTGYGNRFYLDEVNLTSPTGTNELTRKSGLGVYPNPSSGAFNLRFTLSDQSAVKYSVIAITGATLMSSEKTIMEPGQYDIQLNTNQNLPSGIYFVQVELNGVLMTQKMIID